MVGSTSSRTVETIHVRGMEVGAGGWAGRNDLAGPGVEWWVQQDTVSFKFFMAMECGHGCSDKCKSPGSSPASGFLLG